MSITPRFQPPSPETKQHHVRRVGPVAIEGYGAEAAEVQGFGRRRVQGHQQQEPEQQRNGEFFHLPMTPFTPPEIRVARLASTRGSARPPGEAR